VPDPEKPVGPVPLASLAAAFLKLGTIAFGGPAAHIALMQEEFVFRRKWLTDEEFLDRVAAANLIPGPSSTEMAIFIGHSKRGIAGLIIAGLCFIVPAAVLVSLIAAAYVRFGAFPQAGGILRAIKPVVIAVIVQALWHFGRTALKKRFLVLIAIGAAMVSWVSVNPLVVLLLAGLASAAELWLRENRKSAMLPSVLPRTLMTLGSAAAVAITAPVSLWRLFASFLKVGSVVFGSGYVLLAFLRAEFVDQLHWLTEQQLIDAVAVGQFTPGPVFTTATFIGFLLAGIPGAFCATVGIFLPGFVLVAASGPWIPRIRKSRYASAVLDGVVAGSLALMAVVAWQLGRASITDWLTILLAVSSGVLLKFKVNSAWLIAGAALIGLIVQS
jgi:chromate transporter